MKPNKQKNVRRDIRFRVYIAFTCICLLGLAVILKAAAIQVREGKELRERAADLHLRTDTVLAERGNIYTEDGHLLCSTIPQFDVHIDMSVIRRDTFAKYVDSLSAGIAAILQDASAATIKKQLLQGFADSSHYFKLCHNIAYGQFQALRALPVFNKGRRKGGFLADSHIKRVNPYGFLAYRTIGLWRENAQLVGLEGTYDSVLRGQDGSRMMEKMTGGVMMPVEGMETEAQNGQDVVTTLDLSIQNVAEHALYSVLHQFECLNGTAIVMETSTGKIRALVNLGRQTNGTYAEDYNYALQRAEPGSTFKLVTLLSLLNDGYINVEDEVDCEGGAHAFPTRVMHDSHHGLGRMHIREAYAHSSNVAMAKLAFLHYAKNPKQYMKHLEDFGIDKKTGIDLNGELAPVVIKPGGKEWNTNATLPWMATGYGIYINPLRTCMMYNALANNGHLMKPYLVSELRENGRTVRKIEPKELMVVGDSSVIAQLKTCTREVVNSGTGKHIASPFYNISGKTGTAQVADKIGGKWYGYKDGVYQGSFVGYFPSEAPKYTMMVMIRTKPHAGSYFGGLLGAPVFRMISDRIFALGLGSWKGPLDSLSALPQKGLPAQKATTASYQEVLTALGLKAAGNAEENEVAALYADSSRNLEMKPATVIKGQVPDVQGMSLRDAVYLLEREGLRVEMSGRGNIQSQSLPVGSRIIKGQVITLQLS